MIKLYHAYQDNALYQQRSNLTVKGLCGAKEEVTLTVNCENCQFVKVKGIADDNGQFALTFLTPKASFNKYQFVVQTQNESVTINNVLFGELWLACGQSNMELPNKANYEWKEVYKKLKNKNIRVYNARRNPDDGTLNFPYEVQQDNVGVWATYENKTELDKVSSLATDFSLFLYDYLNKKEDVPVGFLNVNYGGTNIETWLPEESYSDNQKIYNFAKEHGVLKNKENWNKAKDNTHQVTCLYGFMVNSLVGLQVRGMLWYQGETNCYEEVYYNIYLEYLQELHKQYKKRFMISGENFFPIVSSQLFPWSYGDDGETKVGYINKVFTTAFEQNNFEFPIVPICDLRATWDFNAKNHPIHPTNKYYLAKRFYNLIATLYYGKKPNKKQYYPATLQSYSVLKNKIKLTFKNVGSGLYFTGHHIRGIYIAGEDHLYLPAKCKIINKNTMVVYNTNLKNPVDVAYAISSFEPSTNLFAGDYPVVPFFTQKDKEKPMPRIMLKPWLDTTVTSTWTHKYNEPVRDVFSNPVYYPTENSFVCYDQHFTITNSQSLRVGGNSNKFGCYVPYRRYQPFDFENYSLLKLSLLNIKGLTVYLNVYEEDKLITSIRGKKIKDLGLGWGRYKFDLQRINCQKISKIEFSFALKDNLLNYVNIDDLELIPKK